jgi:hypothetical protein
MDALSQEQIARAGRVWDDAQRWQCEGFLIMTDGYIQTRDAVQNFALHRWEAMGAKLQADIARVIWEVAALVKKL